MKYQKGKGRAKVIKIESFNFELPHNRRINYKVVKRKPVIEQPFIAKEIKRPATMGGFFLPTISPFKEFPSS